MPTSAEETSHLDLSIDQLDRLCPVAKALSSPMRVRMLALLGVRPMNVNEMAEALELPVSTAALNVRQLEDCGLITTTIQPGVRGAMKLCTRRVETMDIRLISDSEMNDAKTITMQLPIGCYSVAEGITPRCGAVTEQARIGESDQPSVFYHPNHFQAQLLWFGTGELEYRFCLGGINPARIEWIEFSMELSTCMPPERSGMGGIYLTVNRQPLGAWNGIRERDARRGKLNPPWWSASPLQYGELKTWRVDAAGCQLDGVKSSDVTLSDLRLGEHDHICLRLGVRSEDGRPCGLNLFGERFGDYAQGIVMRMGYTK